MPPDTCPQDHHAGSVAGLIECQIQGEAPAREGVRENGQPRPPERATGVGADDFNVQLSVVYVANLQGTIAMARRGGLQLKIEF